MIRAALHLHSTWSDGEFSVAELRDIFGRAGCRVVGVVDHAESFDAERLRAFRNECASLSDEHLLVLPSLEYDCHDRMHIIGYGVTELVGSEDPQTVIRHIADCGGISVIAHPKTEAFDSIAGFERLPDGIEAWNSKYDGRRAPRPQTFEFISDLRGREPRLRAFFGTDLHWRRQFRELYTLIEWQDAALDRDSVLEQLRAGRFSGAAGSLRLASTAQVDDAQLRRFGSANRRGRRLKAAFARAKKITDSLGIRPPAALKAQLRRLF